MSLAPMRRRSPAFVGATLGILAMLGACAPVRTPPLGQAELAATADHRLMRLVAPDQEPVDGPIDLYEAMARALKYNLDDKVQLREQLLRSSELDVKSFDLLPDVVLSLDYLDRDNDPGGSSVPVPEGGPESAATRSEERRQTDADLTLSWDILDVAMARVRSKKASEEVHIAREQRRATINRVIEDTRIAYWRAVSAQRLDHRIDRLENRARAALGQAYAQERARTGAPLDALAYQREMLGVLRSVQELRRDLGIAKAQLGALMNLAPGQHFEVVVPRHAALDAPIVHADPVRLVRMAVINRPELREISYRDRLADLEDDAALIEVFPSLETFIGLNWTSNDLIYNEDWVAHGARASWNVMNVFRLGARRRAIAAQKDLIDARALALTQAVATQVYVALAQVRSLGVEADIARQYHNVSDRISTQTRTAAGEGMIGARDAVREEMNAVLGSLRYDVTYAELQGAFANLYAAVGLDPYSADLHGTESVDAMAQALRRLWVERGDRMARAGTGG